MSIFASAVILKNQKQLLRKLKKRIYGRLKILTFHNRYFFRANMADLNEDTEQFSVRIWWVVFDITHFLCYNKRAKLFQLLFYGL